LKAKLVVTAAFAAAITFCVVGAAGAAPSKTSALTFHLVEKDLAFNYVDNKPLGGPNDPPTLGDMFAFTSTLWTHENKRAGQLFASCVVVSGGKSPVYECTGTFTLKGGQLELQTALRDPGASPKPDHIAIVGGTGVYEGASGSLTSLSRGSNSPYSDDTVHLLLPKGV
jgi:hypothetical protein